MEIERYDRFTYGIRSSSYSKILHQAARETPGVLWDSTKRAWVGWPDGVRECARKITKKGVELGGLLPSRNCTAPRQWTPYVRGPKRYVLRHHLIDDLREYQKEGVDFIVRRAAGGVLLADDLGLGKTVQACRAVAALEKDAIVVCPSFVRDVWLREIQKWVSDVRVVELDGTKPKPFVCPVCFPHPTHPGKCELCGCTAKRCVYLVHYDIVYAWVNELRKTKAQTLVLDEIQMLQSEGSRRSLACRALSLHCKYKIGLSGTPMTSRPRDLWNPIDTLSIGRFGQPWDFYRRHCCEQDTPVWMHDLSYKPLKDVRVGDEVVGWQKNKGSDRYGLVASKVLRVLKRKAGCVKVTFASGRTVICTPDHLWRSHRRSQADGKNEFSHPHVGAKLSFVAPPTPSPKETEQYKYGYVLGALAGDGHVGQTYYPSGSIRHTSVSLRVKSAEFADRFEAFANDCGFKTSRVRRGPMHEVWLLGGDVMYREIYARYRSPETLEECRGWMAGIYDAEGSSQLITQSIAVNPKTVATIKRCLKRLGFAFSLYKSYRKISAGTKTPIATFYLRGGWRGALRFWNLVRPAITYKREWILRGQRHGGRGWFTSSDRVVKATPCGKRTVVSLTTSTGNYIAGGFASKNCDAKQKIVETREGPIAVWDKDGASHLKELNRRLRFFMLRRTKTDVRMELPPRTRQMVELEVKKNFRSLPSKSIKGSKKWLRKAFAIAADGKIPQAVDLIANHVESGSKVIVFSHRKIVAELVTAMLLKRKLDARTITGEMPRKQRTRLIDERHDVLSCTMDSVQVGVDMSYADVAVFVELDYVPSKLLQCEGRVYRFGQKRNTLVQYVIAKNTADEIVRDAVILKLENFEKVIGKTDDDLEDDLGSTKLSTPKQLRSLAERVLEQSKRWAA
jgi:superfamily II DNA or RNA helicase